MTEQSPPSTSRKKLAEKRRADILLAARRLFALHGYHATSMRMINDAVGASEALTYHYFPDGKAQILDTVIREAAAERAAAIGDTLDSLAPEMPLQDALVFLAQTMAERFTTDQEFIQIMIREQRLVGTKYQNAFSANREKLMTPFIEYLQSKEIRKEVRSMDYAMALSQFLCHIGLIALQQIMYGPSFEAKVFMRQVRPVIKFTAELWEV